MNPDDKELNVVGRFAADADKIDFDTLHKFYEIFYYTTQGLFKQLKKVSNVTQEDVLVYRLKVRDNKTGKELSYEVFHDDKDDKVHVRDVSSPAPEKKP